MIVDGIQIIDFAGFQPGDVQNLDAVLFNATNLQETDHQFEIINTSSDPTRPVLDINRVRVHAVQLWLAAESLASDPLSTHHIRYLQYHCCRPTVPVEFSTIRTADVDWRRRIDVSITISYPPV